MSDYTIMYRVKYCVKQNTYEFSLISSMHLTSEQRNSGFLFDIKGVGGGIPINVIFLILKSYC